MVNKCQSILYFFDLVGTSPELYVFNNNRYKTIFTSILSITVLLFIFDYKYIFVKVMKNKLYIIY